MTARCPCGGETKTISETRREQPKAHPVQRWWLQCTVCGAAGPQATGELAADVAWRLLTGQAAPDVVAVAVERIELSARDRKGFAALARELGVTVQSLRNWERGEVPRDQCRLLLLRLIVSD